MRSDLAYEIASIIGRNLLTNCPALGLQTQFSLGHRIRVTFLQCGTGTHSVRIERHVVHGCLDGRGNQTLHGHSGTEANELEVIISLGSAKHASALRTLSSTETTELMSMILRRKSRAHV